MSRVPATSLAERLYRLTVRQFEAMIGAGVFGDDRVELLNGLMVARTTSYPSQTHTVILLAEWLRDQLPRTDWTVREEKSVHLGPSWRPEPDIAVVRGAQTGFARRFPTQADITLLVDVSESTYLTDTGIKLRRYERCGIPAYWVVDLPRRQVEVYTLDRGAYGPAAVYKAADEVPLTLDGLGHGRVSVGQLLA